MDRVVYTLDDSRPRCLKNPLGETSHNGAFLLMTAALLISKSGGPNSCNNPAAHCSTSFFLGNIDDLKAMGQAKPSAQVVDGFVGPRTTGDGVTCMNEPLRPWLARDRGLPR
jgi:hypothetical protein